METPLWLKREGSGHRTMPGKDKGTGAAAAEASLGELHSQTESRAERMTHGGWGMMLVSANFNGSFSAVSRPIFASLL